MSMQEQGLFEFGRYRLNPREHLLLRDGEPVALTPKAFEMLVVLVQRAGRLVDKDELLREIWPDTAVEESNVAQNVFALRRALGDDLEYIETVPKRGYRFVPAVRTVPLVNTGQTLKVEHTLPPPAPSAPAARKSRPIWIAAGLAVLLLAATALVARRYLKPVPLAAPKSPSMTRLLSGHGIPSAAISPDGRYVAHVVETGEQASIMIRQVSTTTDLVIVPPDRDSWYWGLCFSRDGDSLYYIKLTPGAPFTTLYRVSALGGTPRKVATGVDSLIGLSPDGKKIAFVREAAAGKSLLMIANVDVEGERVLATRQRPESSFSGGNRGGPSWSPDGTVIATGVISLSGGYHGYVETVSLKDGNEKKLTSHQWDQVAQSVWLPDGSAVLITARDASAQIWEVTYPAGTARRITADLIDYHGISITADGSALVTVQYDLRSTIAFLPAKPAGALKRSTAGMNEGFYGLSWTPAGELVYASDASGNQDIWIVGADGVSTRQLTHDPEHDSTPSVSPDGRSVVFISRRAGGNQHVWRMDIDGANQKQLTHHESEGTPSFTPDGKWVVYASSGTGIWKVPASGGQPVQLSGGHIHTPSVSPDGTRVVCFYRDEKTSGPNRLAVIPITAGPPLQVLNLPDGFSGATVRWTPDSGSLIHVATQDDISNLWTLPLDGSAPQRLTNFPSDYIFNYAYSRDQKQLGVARGTIAEHAVMIRDFR